MKVQVERVLIPVGSTIGFVFGTTDDGTVEVMAGADHRSARELGEAISGAVEPVEVEIPEWAILAHREVGGR